MLEDAFSLGVTSILFIFFASLVKNWVQIHSKHIFPYTCNTVTNSFCFRTNIYSTQKHLFIHLNRVAAIKFVLEFLNFALEAYAGLGSFVIYIFLGCCSV